MGMIKKLLTKVAICSPLGLKKHSLMPTSLAGILILADWLSGFCWWSHQFSLVKSEKLNASWINYALSLSWSSSLNLCWINMNKLQYWFFLVRSRILMQVSPMFMSFSCCATATVACKSKSCCWSRLCSWRVQGNGYQNLGFQPLGNRNGQ